MVIDFVVLLWKEKQFKREEEKNKQQQKNQQQQQQQKAKPLNIIRERSREKVQNKAKKEILPTQTQNISVTADLLANKLNQWKHSPEFPTWPESQGKHLGDTSLAAGKATINFIC